MKYFKPSEFLHYEKLSPKLLFALDSFRSKLGRAVYVSPVEGAGYRNDNSNSYHCCVSGRNKQSWAIDLFPDCDLWYSFTTILQIPEIKGIGIYPHWSYKHMSYGMHIDIRETPNKIIWYQNKDKEYITIHSMNQFRECLNEYL